MSTVGKVPFILASASPRRRELLQKEGYHFEVIISDFDESSLVQGEMTAAKYASHLALEKARVVAGRFPQAWVVAADTVVEHDRIVIGKAADAVQAKEILTKLFAKPHEVITGLAIMHQNKGIEKIASDTTVVVPRAITEKQIDDYIALGQWEGKAGAYGIQGDADTFVDHLEGSYTNVVGMPMELFGLLYGSVICGGKVNHSS